MYSRDSSLRQKIYVKTVSILGSLRFFYASLVVFVMEASWIALSGLYSMAFDEDAHLGIIRLYADKWLPFWSSQPPGPAPFGAVARDPSYMYHYLMSFPYRLIDVFTHNQTYQVLILRFTSIAIFFAGLVIYRKVLLGTKASKALVHTVLALLILTPMSPFLAAQINYDNWIFLLTAITLLLAMRFGDELKQKGKLNIKLLVVLTAAGMFASLVKYAYLPIFAAIVIWVGVVIYRHLGKQGKVALLSQAKNSWQALSIAMKVFLVGLLLLFFGLFFERYGVNTVRYHTPIPECDQVLSIDRCSAYGPWLRNYQTHQDKIHGLLAPTSTSPIRYTFITWLGTMMYQLFFVLNGAASHFDIKDPLIVPRVMSIVLGVIGAGLVLYWQKRLRQRFKLNFLLFASLVYVAVLWAQEYSDFLHIGFAFAIQGRYLLPVLPILYLVVALAFSKALNPAPYLKALLAWLVIGVLLLEGGGAMTFILRSDPSWWWPNSVVVRANQIVQNIFRKFVIGA